MFLFDRFDVARIERERNAENMLGSGNGDTCDAETDVSRLRSGYRR